jgi:hypothetical protein
MFSWYSSQIFPLASRYYSSGSNYYWYNRYYCFYYYYYYYVVFAINLLQDIYNCILTCTLVQALGLSTGRTAHRGSRGIALLFHDQRQ